MDRPIEDLLRCPVTRSGLEPLDRAALERLNVKIEREELWHLDGSPVRHSLEAALRAVDGALHYGVREGIHLLLPSLAMVDSRDRVAAYRRDVGDAQRIVMDFYDSCAKEEADRPFGESASFAAASLTDFLQELILAGHPITAQVQQKGWVEIHDFESYRLAIEELSRQ